MFSAKQDQPKRSDTAEFHTRAVQRVINNIQTRLDESISLKEMAALAYMSRFHFVRTFRQITGLPPRRFLSALRVQSATRKLLETDHSVTDICLDVGYSSLGTFVRRFSESLGVSPLKLRSMRQSSGKDLLTPLTKMQTTAEDSAPSVLGRILAPTSFSGPIFIGLFASPIPEGTPLACTLQYAPGTFWIKHVPSGHHYLFAVGLPWPERVSDFFSHESALRGGGQSVSVDRRMVECSEIYLRAATPIDPPILVNLPILLNKAGRSTRLRTPAT
jgi:AraC family transcriptional regulator